jgi:translation initiation factor IF-3
MPCIARFMSRVQALQCSKKVKLRSARTFLKNGDRIKLTVALRGREIQHADLALALLNRFGKDLGELTTWNDEPKLDGKKAVMVLSPSR